MNMKKCSVVHIKKEVQHTTGFKAGQIFIINYIGHPCFDQ